MYVLLGISIVVLWAVGPIAVVVMADRHREQLRRLREQLCPHCRQKVDKLGGAADGSGAAQVGEGEPRTRGDGPQEAPGVR